MSLPEKLVHDGIFGRPSREVLLIRGRPFEADLGCLKRRRVGRGASDQCEAYRQEKGVPRCDHVV